MHITLNKVLVSDAVDPACVNFLKEHGVEVTCKYKMAKEDLIEEVKKHDALIVRSETKVTSEVLNAGTSLKIVGRAGTGVDNIDIDSATRKGIIVINTPGGNSTSACELTCAMITSLARNVAQACESLKAGRWDRKLYTGSELSGKTLAVLGMGRIGKEVTFRMQAFGMRVVGFDPHITPEEAVQLNIEKMELDEIWPHADYITVHTPLIPQTKNLINDEVLNKCKKGVRIINVARGGIVDEAALLTALKDGRCGGAALDVFCEEPPTSKITAELIKHPKVVATPHLGASTEEAQQRVAVEIAEQFLALAGKGNFPITGVVNAPVLAAEMKSENAPWIDLGRELGKVVGKMVQDLATGTTISVNTTGVALQDMYFLRTAALTGVLSSHSQKGLNLINAPTLAKDGGISVVQYHDGPGSNTVRVSVTHPKEGCYSVKGTVRSDNLPYLLTIDDSSFGPAGVHLVNFVRLFQCQNPQSNINTVVSELVQKRISITNIAVAPGKTSWLAVKTAEDISNLKISGIL